MCQYKLHFFSFFSSSTLATEAHDDDGLPHTLEHLIFLGSEDYPYKVQLWVSSLSLGVFLSVCLSNPRPSELKCYIVKSQNKVSIYHNAVYFYLNKSLLECFKLEEVIFTDVPCACVCAHSQSHVLAHTHTHTQHANYILVGIVWNWKIYLVC